MRILHSRPPALLAILVTVQVVLFWSAQALAQSPPLLTDDPGTPGNGRWEVNIVTSMERGRDHRSFEAPLFDINYGVGNNLQINFEVPWLVRQEQGEKTQRGLGNTSVGVKWRFLNREKNGIDMSVHPQIELENQKGPTESELAETGPRLSLPVQAAFRAGPVELTGELGYTFVKGDSNETFYGAAVSRDVSSRVEIQAEIFGISENRFRDNEVVFNVGTVVKLSKRLNLVSAAGRSIHMESGQGPITLATLGIQLLLKRPL